MELPVGINLVAMYINTHYGMPGQKGVEKKRIDCGLWAACSRTNAPSDSVWADADSQRKYPSRRVHKIRLGLR
jgi:hypothetical protein